MESCLIVCKSIRSTRRISFRIQFVSFCREAMKHNYLHAIAIRHQSEKYRLFGGINVIPQERDLIDSVTL